MSAVALELRIAAIQTDIHWLEPEQNYANVASLLENVEADVFVLPETFATGFAFEESQCGEAHLGNTVAFMQKMAAQKNAAVCGSVAVTLYDGTDKKANRLYFVEPNGDVHFYDKRHLFRMGNEQESVAAGQERVIVEFRGVRFLLQVCYDLRFPVFQRNHDDYDVMINVANWPAVRRYPWDTLLRARAMENQCYVIGVNRIGIDGRGTEHNGGSVILDFKGEHLVSAKDNLQQVITASISLQQLNEFKQAFPAYRDADEFEIKL